MEKQIIISWLFLLVFSGTCFGQSPEELLGIALENNLELKVLKEEYLASLEKAPQVSQFPDPEFGIGVFPLPVETRLGGQLFRLSGTQMFPWFGSRDQKSDLEKAKSKAVFERISVRATDLLYQIKKAYLQVYKIEEKQKIIQQNQKLLDALERLALSRIESGKGSAADVLQVQLKKEALKQELSILENESKKPLIVINQLLNRQLDTPVKLEDAFSFATLPVDKDSIASIIKSNHPLLRIFELQQSVAQESIQVNALNGKPKFGVGLDYILVDKRSDAQPVGNGRDILQVRASVKIPLHQEAYAAKEREEKLKINALEFQKADLLSQLLAHIEKAYADHKTAQLKNTLYQQQIKITKSAVQILETNYSAQGNKFEELLQLEMDLIDYDLKILENVIQSQLAKIEVERFLDYPMVKK